MPGPGITHVNKPSSRTFKILSKDGQGTLGTVNAEMLLVSTMTQTDMSLYRLSSTYQEIESKYHTRALTLLDKHPVEGTKIEILSGYWKRAYNCSIEYFVDTLKEAGWTMKDSIRYLQPGCETIGGTSGSPIIHSETREVVGVNNTGNENGERCTMDNPCEVDKNGTVKVQKGASYGQQTYIVYSCLDKGSINLDKQGCMIPKTKRTGGDEPAPTPKGGW
jgi:V8-like Glu-specific endopeptidase